MDTALLIARLLLAAVFLVAGLAKLADRAGSRQAVADFGMPSFLATPLGLLVPLAELAVAVALVVRPWAWWGALGALALLVAFVVGIAVNMARGRAPDCRCFGQLHSSPVGWPTLVRNGLLAAVAGFIVAQGRGDVGPGVASWFSGLTSVQQAGIVGGVVLAGVLALIGSVLLNLVRQNGRLLISLEQLEARLDAGGVAAAPDDDAGESGPGLPVGTPAPVFSLSGLHGETLTLDFLRAPGKPVVLVFADPGCSPCNALMPDIGRYQREHAERFTLAMISRGSPEDNRAKSAEHGLVHVLLQQDQEVADAYQLVGTPSAVVVRPDGSVGSAMIAGRDSVRAMLDDMVASTATPTGGAAAAPLPLAVPAHSGSNGSASVAAQVPTTPQVGDPVPSVKLRDLNGKTVDLASFRADRTLMLFWNPACGFCSQMLPELKEWDNSAPKGAPKLVVISSGDFEANKAMGLRSRVLLDDNFSAGSAFGANGTPMAVVVDRDGRIASPLAAGSTSVMKLVKGE